MGPVGLYDVLEVNGASAMCQEWSSNANGSYVQYNTSSLLFTASLEIIHSIIFAKVKSNAIL